MLLKNNIEIHFIKLPQTNLYVTRIEISIKKRLDSRHPEDSLQLRRQAETPQCWCDQQNKPSAGRFDGPEARETRRC